MVSKASDDLPDPLSPVMTVKVLRGIATSIFLRLCCRAPWTVISLSKPPFSHTRPRRSVYSAALDALAAPASAKPLRETSARKPPPNRPGPMEIGMHIHWHEG